MKRISKPSTFVADAARHICSDGWTLAGAGRMDGALSARLYASFLCVAKENSPELPVEPVQMTRPAGLLRSRRLDQINARRPDEGSLA